MVRKLFFGLITFSAFIINAQDLIFTVDGSDVSGTIINVDVNETDFTGEYTGEISLKLKNVSSNDIEVAFLRHNIENDGLTTHGICHDFPNDNGQCVDANPAAADQLFFENGALMHTGEEAILDIHARLGTELIDAYSHELYTAYEVGNETNKVEVAVNFIMTATDVNEIANNLIVSKPYPNPANENVSFNYNLASNGYITIHDLTGKQIGNVELVQGMEKATFNTSDINAGIYFYNIYVDGVKASTDKFIVRH